MEIDVEDIEEGTNGFWKTVLTQNGHYSVEDDEEHEGYVKPKLIENWTEGQEYDFEVNVTAPPIKLQEKDCIVTNNTIVENVEPDQNFDGLSNVNVYNQVVVPSLETLNNKRIYSEGLVTVENLMTDSSTNQGITKESTLNFDLYVPKVTFNTITNNNVNYTLSQLTQDQSDYFSKDSIIKANITRSKKQISINNFYIKYGTESSFDHSMPIAPSGGYTKLNFNLINGNSSWGQWKFYVIIGSYNNNFTIGFYQPPDSVYSDYYLGLYRSDVINVRDAQYVWIYYLENNNYNLMAVFRDNQGSRADMNFVYLSDYELV